MQNNKHKTTDVMAAGVEKHFPRLRDGDLYHSRQLFSLERQAMAEAKKPGGGDHGNGLNGH